MKIARGRPRSKGLAPEEHEEGGDCKTPPSLLSAIRRRYRPPSSLFVSTSTRSPASSSAQRAAAPVAMTSRQAAATPVFQLGRFAHSVLHQNPDGTREVRALTRPPQLAAASGAGVPLVSVVVSG